MDRQAGVGRVIAAGSLDNQMVSTLLAIKEGVVVDGTSQGGQMSRASASHSDRSGNPKVAGSNPDLAFSNPGRVKPMTLKLILVAS